MPPDGVMALVGAASREPRNKALAPFSPEAAPRPERVTTATALVIRLATLVRASRFVSAPLFIAVANRSLMNSW